MFKQIPNAENQMVDIQLDGKTIQASLGMSVAAAVLSHGKYQYTRHTRTTPVSGAKRAPFCMMGVCYDCLMVIDGKPNQRACSISVVEGMVIQTQQGTTELLGDQNIE